MRNPDPDISSILRALREQVEKLESQVHLSPVDSLQHIKDVIADSASLPEVQTELDPLLATLRQQARKLPVRVRFYDVGTVQRIGDGVAMLSGLPHARTDELVTFPTGVKGLVLNLDQTHIDVILLGSDQGIQGGDLVTGTGRRHRQDQGIIFRELGNGLGHHIIRF